MTPSVGKTYYSTDFLQINSAVYMKVETGFEFVNYLNLGFLSDHVARGGERRDWTSLSAVLPDWYKATEGRMSRKRALETFLESHKGLLKFVPSTVSWWLPQALGGVGLEPDGETPVDLSFPAKRRATALLAQNWRERPNLIVRTSTDCLVSRDAMSRLNPKNLTGDGDDVIQDEGEWLDVVQEGEEDLSPAHIKSRGSQALKSVVGLPGFSKLLWNELLCNYNQLSPWKAFEKPRVEDSEEDPQLAWEKAQQEQMERITKKLKAYDRKSRKVEGCAPEETLLKYVAPKTRVNPSIVRSLGDLAAYRLTNTKGIVDSLEVTKLLKNLQLPTDSSRGVFNSGWSRGEPVLTQGEIKKQKLLNKFKYKNIIKPKLGVDYHSVVAEWKKIPQKQELVKQKRAMKAASQALERRINELAGLLGEN
jgi:hypothetical protein